MELKPCPFCGGLPYTSGWNHSKGELTQPTAQVRCDCGCSGPERYGKSCACEAEKVWNKRDQADLRKLVETAKRVRHNITDAVLLQMLLDDIKKLLEGKE